MSGIQKISGVYRITCTANNKIYVGSSVNLRKRWQSHINHLRRGEHANGYLQNAWNKYGHDAFVFDVLEICEQDVLIIREQHFLDTLTPYDEKGFNIALNARASTLGRKATPEAIANLTIALRGRIMPQSHRDSLSARMKGKSKSVEQRAKTSASLKGHSVPIEQRIKQAAKVSKIYIVTPPDGVDIEILNLKQFCRDNNLTYHRMIKVARGRQPFHKRWLCRYP